MSESTLNMGGADTRGGIAECQECGTVSVSETPADRGGKIASIDATAINQPDLPVVLRDVFGISETGLEACRWLLEHDTAPAADIAASLDVDRSTVNRQLNRLTELGVVEKRRRLLTDGGYVNVYTAMDIETVQNRLLVALDTWRSEARALVDGFLDETRQDSAHGDETTDGHSSIYWDV